MNEDKIGIKALEKLLTDTNGNFSEEACEDIFMKSKLKELSLYKEWLNAISDYLLFKKNSVIQEETKEVLNEIRCFVLAALRGDDCFLKGDEE